MYNYGDHEINIKLQLHDAIYRLQFYSKSLIHILWLSNSHNNVVSIQKNRGDKSHRVIVALKKISMVGMLSFSFSYYKIALFEKKYLIKLIPLFPCTI